VTCESDSETVCRYETREMQSESESKHARKQKHCDGETDGWRDRQQSAVSGATAHEPNRRAQISEQHHIITHKTQSPHPLRATEHSTLKHPPPPQSRTTTIIPTSHNTIQSNHRYMTESTHTHESEKQRMEMRGEVGIDRPRTPERTPLGRRGGDTRCCPHITNRYGEKNVTSRE